MTEMKRSIRGGMSGFVKDGQVVGSDANSCLRRTLLRDHGIEEKHTDAKTRNVFHLGALNETIFETWLIEAGKKFVKEKEFCEPVTEGSNFVGHEDFVAENPDGTFTCYELKSVSSPNTYKKIFKEGKPKISNLAQIVNYMVAQQTEYGKLCYTSYIKAIQYKEMGEVDQEEINNRVYEALESGEIETRIFEVNLREEGDIYVDGQPSGFNVTHTLEHRRLSAYVLENEKVWMDPPQSVDVNDPCTFCPFSRVCAKNVLDTDEFLTLCREVIANG